MLQKATNIYVRVKKIKILYLITALDIGGAEKILLSTLKKMDQSIFEPVVVSLYRNGSLIEDFREAGAKVHCIGYTCKFNPFIIKKIARLIHIEKPTIVHTHLPHATIWGRIAAYFSNVKILFTTEHNISVWKRKNLFFFLLYKITYRLNTEIIAVSQSIKKFMINEFALPEQKIEVIYNGVDLEKMKSEAACPEDLIYLSHPIIGTVGRLHKTKGHKYLVEGFRKVVQKFPKAHLLIVGDGDQKENLEKQISEMGLNNSVHLLGLRNDVAAILQLIDVFVFPSLEEGLGIALIEACAVGKPCVATNVGGIPEIIEDGKSGFLIPHSNHILMADMITRLLQDRKLSRTISMYGKKIVRERFDILETAKKVQKLYKQAVKELKKPVLN